MGSEAQQSWLEFALVTNQESEIWGRHRRGGAPQAAQGVAAPFSSTQS
jgi:hypothetical protein